jgi:hypothetical protein
VSGKTYRRGASGLREVPTCPGLIFAATSAATECRNGVPLAAGARLALRRGPDLPVVLLRRCGLPAGTRLPRRRARCARLMVVWLAALEDERRARPDRQEFRNHHIRLEIPDDKFSYAIWQHSGADGDYVRYSTTEEWDPFASPVPGDSYPSGNRVLLVQSDGRFEFIYSLKPAGAKKRSVRPAAKKRGILSVTPKKRSAWQRKKQS